MDSNDSFYDVMIVGMGPVGATLACLLGREGLSVMIVDRELAIYDKPRAIVLDHEALRVLQFCGIDRSFFESVSPHTGTDFVGTEGQLIKLFDPKAPPFELGWPPNVMFIQPELEEALARAMARCPSVKFLRGIDVTGTEEAGDAVRVDTVDGKGVPRRFRASWVIGADGANSTVRQAAGLEIDDMDFAEWWVVLDAWLTGEADLPAKTTQYCNPARPGTFVVGPRNLRRWEIKLLPGEDPAAYREEAKVREVLADFADVDALSIWRSAVYRFRAAVSRGWRNGRLLIAGDAAHTTPPFLAQGLCAGMRDAGNLAWKLAQVVRRGADPALLDSYETERKPHVSDIIRHAKEFGLIIGELDAGRAAERDVILAAQLSSGEVPTERQAFIPPLRHGLIDSRAAGAGSLFVQPKVQGEEGQDMLMDDVVPPDFLIVATDPAMLAMDAALARRWASIGGRRLLVGEDGPVEPGIDLLRDAEGLIARWLKGIDATAVVVRPDRYVYGAAADVVEVRRMARDIVAAHGARADAAA